MRQRLLKIPLQNVFKIRIFIGSNLCKAMLDSSKNVPSHIFVDVLKKLRIATEPSHHRFPEENPKQEFPAEITPLSRVKKTSLFLGFFLEKTVCRLFGVNQRKAVGSKE